jgi:hypothetical protein
VGELKKFEHKRKKIERQTVGINLIYRLLAGQMQAEDYVCPFC